MPEESKHTSPRRSYDPGESVCETTWSAIVLLGLDSSEKPVIRLKAAEKGRRDF